MKTAIKVVLAFCWLVIVLLLIYWWLYRYKFNNVWCLWTNEWCTPICERFVNDCREKEIYNEYKWLVIYSEADDWSLNKKCPNICLLYTESRWYFIDKQKQEKYREQKKNECEAKLEQLRKEDPHNIPKEICNKNWVLYTPIN